VQETSISALAKLTIWRARFYLSLFDEQVPNVRSRSASHALTSLGR
jgi:hypothetical protein